MSISWYRLLALLILCFLVIFLSACVAPAPTPAPSTPAPTEPPLIIYVTPVPPTAAPTKTPVPAPTLAPLKLPGAVTEIAKGFGSPDDLALMPDGSVLFSDEGNGTVNRITTTGQVIPLINHLQVPEGIVVLPDGSLLIVEQGKNRLLQMRFNSDNPLSTFLQFENTTGQEGVDNIARDAATGDLIIPDAPNGRVLRVSADGKTTRVIATGLQRPASAAVERDGSILIADELARAVKRIHSDGSIETLGNFASPDDVVVDSAGNIFVANLGDDSVRMVDPKTRAVTLIANARAPQGLVVDGDGNLIVTESTANRIIRIRIR